MERRLLHYGDRPIAAIDPIYTVENCRTAYQLIWGLSVFWKHAPGNEDWLEDLKQATEQDHVRILKHHFEQPDFSQFLVSTQPQVVASKIPASVKGRLQYLVREAFPKAFQRNYSLRSIGSTKREKLEQYLGVQLDHHPMADERVQQQFAQYQIHCPDIDLSAPRQTAHAQYWYNLHIVFENEGGWREIRHEALQAMHDMLLTASKTKGQLLSRAAIVSDHLHLTLGCHPDESPLEVALSYMNNLAYACGMKPIFKSSCFVGSFGEYDLGAIE